MKIKLQSFIILLLFSILLSSCSNASNKLPEKAIDLGKRAVEVIDDFLNKDISAHDAYEIIKSMDDKFDDILNSEERTLLEESPIFNLQLKIANLRTEFLLIYSDETRSSSKIKEMRKEIADYIK